MYGRPLYEQVTGKIADGKQPSVSVCSGRYTETLLHIWCAACWKTVLTSFVNRIADLFPLDELVADPVAV